MLQDVPIILYKGLPFQHDRISGHWTVIGSNFLHALDALIKAALLCDSIRISSFGYPLLLHMWVKYLKLINQFVSHSVDAPRYTLLLVDAIPNTFLLIWSLLMILQIDVTFYVYVPFHPLCFTASLTHVHFYIVIERYSAFYQLLKFVPWRWNHIVCVTWR